MRSVATMNSIDAFLALFIMLKLRVLLVKENPPSFTENKNALSLKLLSAAAKAEISGGTHDTFVST